MNNRAFSLTIFRKLSYFQFETIRGLIPLLSTFPPLLAGRQLAFYCTGFWSILSDHFLDKDDASFSGSRMLKKAWLKRYISRALGKSFSSFDLLTLWFAIRAVALHLMLNYDKTELLVLHARHRPQPPLESILVCSDVIYSWNSAKNNGGWFDTVMSMDKQINSTRSVCFLPPVQHCPNQ